MKKRSVTCYNMILPVWLLFSPWGLPIWGSLFWGAQAGLVFFILLAGNFIIDLGVTALGMRLARMQGIKERLWRSIIRVWLLGYAADALGTMPLLTLSVYKPSGLSSEWWYYNIEGPIYYGNPFTSIWAVLSLAACLLLTGVLIYLFNMRWGLKNAGLETAQKRKVALTLAVLTAPYTLLIPTSWFYI